jgi:hypothetical protein
MLASKKIIDVKDILDLKLTIENLVNVNVDAKLVVDPCKDKKITDFVGQDMNNIRSEHAKLIKKVEITSITSTLTGEMHY